jgi:acyl-CoA thioesterase-2
MGSAADLLQLLDLEPLEVNLFRGNSRDIGSQRVFGGQVLGQSVVAACRTGIEDRLVHSMHAYFLRGGDMARPIIYEVDRSRDGKSFATRRVLAIQHGQQIFHASVSFQRPEDGLNYQVQPPDVPRPSELVDWVTWVKQYGADIPSARVALSGLPFELRFIEPERIFLRAEPQEPRINLWFKTIGRLPDDENLHRCILAYASDLFLLGAAFQPHGRTIVTTELQVASIDHAMWFHRPVRVDEWLLYSIDSPSSSGGRGLSRGSIFSENGTLVASTAQEGLMRHRPRNPPKTTA